MAERLIRMNEVVKRTGLSRSVVYDRMREGTFPRALKLSERCIAWPESRVQKWIDDFIAEQDAAA